MSKQYVDTVWQTLRQEATVVAGKEPLMRPLFEEAILQHNHFKEALSYRLATKLKGKIIDSQQWLKIFQEAYRIQEESLKEVQVNEDSSVPTTDPATTEHLGFLNVDLEIAACMDLIAVQERDPACDSILTAFMYFKGYKSLQIYRVSHVLWNLGRRELACLMQSRSSEVFAVDIHPGARIGIGLMMDHATGTVIGETAVVGDHCSFLHGVTLGGTGKESGDRHPKLGNNVSIGCNASILGNIYIGDNVKIGAGSVVLKPLPANCTAVGSPARIVGGGKVPTPPTPATIAKEESDKKVAEQRAITAASCIRNRVYCIPQAVAKSLVDVESHCPCGKTQCNWYSHAFTKEATSCLLGMTLIIIIAVSLTINSQLTNLI